MNSYLSKSYAWKVPQSELSISQQPTSPLVYDCAVKYNGMPLNDALMKGPYLMNSLTGVLSRFRKDRKAMVADVEAIFHQIKVDSLHIDALRFLWWANGDLSKEPIIC